MDRTKSIQESWIVARIILWELASSIFDLTLVESGRVKGEGGRGEGEEREGNGKEGREGREARDLGLWQEGGGGGERRGRWRGRR
jgi:hypothetical protein